MATIYELIKLRAQRNKSIVAERERVAHPLDAGLPFGLHIGGKIDINPLVPEGLFMKIPPRTQIVQAFSRGEILDYSAIRVLLHPETEEGKVSYLLILQKGGETLVRWFLPLDEVYPQNDDDWLFWIAEDDGMIGYPAFQPKAEVPEIVPPLYKRTWNPGETRIAPIAWEETVYPDRYDPEQRFVVTRESMLYGRRVEGNFARDELILLSTVKEPDGEYIAVDIGIDIEPASDLKVLY